MVAVHHPVMVYEKSCGSQGPPITSDKTDLAASGYFATRVCIFLRLESRSICELDRFSINYNDGEGGSILQSGPMCWSLGSHVVQNDCLKYTFN